METADRSLRLQQVADHRTVRKTLRGSSIGSLVFGALALLGGIAPPFDPVLTAVGAVLLSTGIWNLLDPRPTGILLDGCALLVVGLYNVAGALFALSQGQHGTADSLFVKLGVFQIAWGAASFWRFRRFRDAFRDPPTEAESRQLDGMVNVLWKTKAKESVDVIEFVSEGLHAKAWKARLSPTLAVLATDRGHEVVVAEKDQFDIEDRGKVMLGSARKATFVVRGKRWKGHLPADSLERFQQWKTGVVIPRAIAA